MSGHTEREEEKESEIPYEKIAEALDEFKIFSRIIPKVGVALDSAFGYLGNGTHLMHMFHEELEDPSHMESLLKMGAKLISGLSRIAEYPASIVIPLAPLIYQSLNHGHEILPHQISNSIFQGIQSSLPPAVNEAARNFFKSCRFVFRAVVVADIAKSLGLNSQAFPSFSPTAMAIMIRVVTSSVFFEWSIGLELLGLAGKYCREALEQLKEKFDRDPELREVFLKWEYRINLGIQAATVIEKMRDLLPMLLKNIKEIGDEIILSVFDSFKHFFSHVAEIFGIDLSTQSYEEEEDEQEHVPVELLSHRDPPAPPGPLTEVSDFPEHTLVERGFERTVTEPAFVGRGFERSLTELVSDGRVLTQDQAEEQVAPLERELRPVLERTRAGAIASRTEAQAMQEAEVFEINRLTTAQREGLDLAFMAASDKSSSIVSSLDLVSVAPPEEPSFMKDMFPIVVNVARVVNVVRTIAPAVRTVATVATSFTPAGWGLRAASVLGGAAISFFMGREARALEVTEPEWGRSIQDRRELARGSFAAEYHGALELARTGQTALVMAGRGSQGSQGSRGAASTEMTLFSRSGPAVSSTEMALREASREMSTALSTFNRGRESDRMASTFYEQIVQASRTSAADLIISHTDHTGPVINISGRSGSWGHWSRDTGEGIASGYTSSRGFGSAETSHSSFSPHSKNHRESRGSDRRGHGMFGRR
jgi:hypothetical protein